MTANLSGVPSNPSRLALSQCDLRGLARFAATSCHRSIASLNTAAQDESAIRSQEESEALGRRPSIDDFSDVRDTWGTPTWDVCGAGIQASGATLADGKIPAGWLPSAFLAQQWRAFVTQPTHETTSLP